MKKLTQKQQFLFDHQQEDQLITYINPKGDRVYGLARFGVADIYTTLSLRSLEVSRLKVLTPFPCSLRSGLPVDARYCEIV